MSGNRIPTNTISPSRISRAALATISSPSVYPGDSTVRGVFFEMSTAGVVVTLVVTLPFVSKEFAYRPSLLEVNRRLARLRDGHQRIASSLLGRNPFLFIGDDFEQQLSVSCTRHVIFQVLLVGLIVERHLKD